MMYLCLTAFIIATYGQLAENVNTGTSTRCNNYIARSATAFNDGLEFSWIYPVGKCSHENSRLRDDGTSQNWMYKCEEASNGTAQACSYRMGLNCEGEIEKGACYPCNGAEDQCECEIGGDASECQVYEAASYEAELDENDELYCNREKVSLVRKVINMCIQGSSGGLGASSNYNHACGASKDYYSKDNVFDPMYQYNDGKYAADCNSVSTPTSAPTDSNPRTISTTLFGEESDEPYCYESTCDGMDSPRADSRAPTTVFTDAPSMSPVSVSDTPSSSSNATLNALLIILIVSFTF